MSLAESSVENVYRFDDVVVDCENFRAQRNGRKIIMTPRAFDVLVFLLKNGGRVVEKQELFDNVWKETFVSDNALTKIIKEIRHVLEDHAENPRYIETVPKRGYRFIGEISETDDQTDQKIEIVFSGNEAQISRLSTDRKASPRFAFSKTIVALSLAGLAAISGIAAWLLLPQPPGTPRTTPIRSIAVLPFKPIDADSGDESLEMGMAATLITRLSNLRQVL